MTPTKSGITRKMCFNRQESLGYLINHLGRLFARALDRRLSKHDMPLGQFPLLLILWEEEGLTQSEIARRLDIEQPTVANTIRRMERDGLIKTACDPEHRKRVLIKLTAKGRALEGPLTAEARAVNEAAIAGLSAHDIDVFRKMVRLLEEGLNSESE